MTNNSERLEEMFVINIINKRIIIYKEYIFILITIYLKILHYFYGSVLIMPSVTHLNCLNQILH
jgi:hypothetical protein